MNNFSYYFICFTNKISSLWPINFSKVESGIIRFLGVVLTVGLLVSGCQRSQQVHGSAASGFSEETSEARPNILFIFSDDHSTQAVGAYHGRLADLNPTPNIDKLASQGMLFTNAFVTNSICTPSRAVLETGQYSMHNGVLTLGSSQSLPPRKDYLPIELEKLGYQTAIIGKWHLYAEPARYDFYEVSAGMGRYFNPRPHRKGHGEWPRNRIQLKGFSTDIKTKQAIKWLKGKVGHRNKTKPFYLALHYHAPHEPWSFAKRYQDYLKGVTIPAPSSMYHMLAPPSNEASRGYYAHNKWNPGSVSTRGKNDSLIHIIGSSIGRRNHIRNMGKSQRPEITIDTSVSDRQYMNEAYQTYLHRYLRCVKGMDDNIGRLIEFLKRKELYNNTIIIYSSDQGMLLGEHDYYDKRWMYDPSIHIPLIIRYPKMINSGSVSDALISNVDFAPTIIDLAGGSVPGYMDGRSFASILTTGKTSENWRTAIYSRYWMHMFHHGVPAYFGLRTKRFKLIFYYGRLPKGYSYNGTTMGMVSSGYPFPIVQTPPGWEFYDLRKDPREMDNRYHNPAYQDTIAALKKKLRRIRHKFQLTDKGKNPKIQQIIQKYWNR